MIKDIDTLHKLVMRVDDEYKNASDFKRTFMIACLMLREIEKRGEIT